MREKLPWYGLQVRPRFEKTVSEMLRGKGYEEFLPLYRTSNRWSDRVKTVELPLFPGYLFCRLDVNLRLPVLTTPGVTSIIGCGKMPVAVDPEQIEEVFRLARSGVPMLPWPYLREGQRVRINHGAMKDVEGILISFKKQYRLVLSVTLLQRSVSVEIDRDAITPLGPMAGMLPMMTGTQALM
jgi:transcription antitermination factor NusG